jgi:hypothetical protein
VAYILLIDSLAYCGGMLFDRGETGVFWFAKVQVIFI